jgi:hypothetical protein
MKKTLLTAIAISGLLVSLMVTSCPYPVRADSIDFISFDSGVTIFSPINMTYNSRHLTLNLTLFSAGSMGGIDSGISMNYSIDGIYNGPVPLEVSNPGIHIITNGAGIVDLPELPEGSHCLTIYLLGLNQKYYEPRYLSYVNTVYFIIDDTNSTPIPTYSATTLATSSPSPTMVPTSTPISTNTPSPSPSSETSASPSIEPSPSIPEFPSLAVVSFLMVAVLVGAIIHKKKTKQQKQDTRIEAKKAKFPVLVTSPESYHSELWDSA